MNRTNRITLSPDSSSVHELLQADDGGQCWRLIEAWSQKGLPWVMVLEWSLAGGLPGIKTLISVSHAVRVCVYAAALNLSALNRATSDNPVGARVVDGCMPTQNVYDIWASCDGVNPVSLTVPAFAQRLALMLEEPAAAPGTSVSLIAGDGQKVTTLGMVTPDYGLALGSAVRIELLTPDATRLRALFFLSL